jgi:hypothetical protein
MGVGLATTVTNTTSSVPSGVSLVAAAIQGGGGGGGGGDGFSAAALANSGANTRVRASEGGAVDSLPQP